MRLGCAAIALLCVVTPSTSASQNAPVAGWLERARISPGELVLEAKLDSAARTSSLHATNIERFQREGTDWVAFDAGADGVRIERPLVRTARIRSAPHAEEERPVVKLGICIGSVYRVTEVNLVDRTDLAKPLLVGRRFLRGRLLVDTKRRYLLDPVCKPRTLP